MEKRKMTDQEETKENRRPTFEEAAAELQSIVDRLNSGSVPLDEMVALYEKGAKLSEYCTALLKEYDGRIEKAVRGTSGGAEL